MKEENDEEHFSHLEKKIGEKKRALTTKPPRDKTAVFGALNDEDPDVE